MPRLRAHSERRSANVANRNPRSRDESRTREDRIGERITPQPDGCWTYDESGCNPAGYGVNETSVHRYVYEVLVGPIPDGHHLHHLCHNRSCCRPAHLQPVTPAEHRRIHTAARQSD